MKTRATCTATPQNGRHQKFKVTAFLAVCTSLLTADAWANIATIAYQDFTGYAGSSAGTGVQPIPFSATLDGTVWCRYRARPWANTKDPEVGNESITLATSSQSRARWIASPEVSGNIGVLTFRTFLPASTATSPTAPHLSLFMGPRNDYTDVSAWPVAGVTVLEDAISLDTAQTGIWVTHTYSLNRTIDPVNPQRIFLGRMYSDPGYDVLIDDIVIYEMSSSLQEDNPLTTTEGRNYAISGVPGQFNVIHPEISFTTVGTVFDVSVTLHYRFSGETAWTALAMGQDGGVYHVQGGSLSVGTQSGVQLEMYVSATYTNAEGTQAAELTYTVTNPLRIDVLPRSPRFDTHTNLVVAGALEAPMDASTNGVWVGVYERRGYTPVASSAWRFDFGEGAVSTSRSYGDDVSAIPFKGKVLTNGRAFPAPEATLERDVIFRYEEPGQNTSKGTALTGDAQTFEDWAATQTNGWSLVGVGPTVVADEALALHGTNALYLPAGASLVLDKTARPGVKEIGFWMRRADSSANAAVTLVRHRAGTVNGQADTLATFTALPTDRYVFRSFSIDATQNPMETDGIGITAATPVYLDGVYVSDCSTASLTSLSFDREPPLKRGETVTVSATFAMEGGARFRDGDNKVAVVWGQGNSAASATNTLYAIYDASSGAWRATLPAIERGDADLYVWVEADVFDFGGDPIATITSATNCLTTVPSSNFETLAIRRTVGGAVDNTPMRLAADGFWKGALAAPSSAQSNAVFEFEDDLGNRYGGEEGANKVPASGMIKSDGRVTAASVDTALAFEFDENTWTYNVRKAKYAPLDGALPTGWTTVGTVAHSATGSVFQSNAQLVCSGNTGVDQVWFWAKRTTAANVAYTIQTSTSDSGSDWVSASTGVISGESLRFFSQTIDLLAVRRVRVTFAGGPVFVQDAVVTALVEVSCDVTLNPRGGSGGTASVTATYGAAMPTITPPTRDGHTFLGYWSEPDAGGTQYYTAAGASAGIWNQKSLTATLYARWMVADGDYTETVTGIEWSFTVANGVANVTGATPASGDLSIPATLSGCPVTRIKNSAFQSCSGLTSVTIPDGVTSIGSRAFADCTSLSNIWVEIGNSAYIAIDGVLFSASATELIAYPAGRTGSYAIPDGVTSIGNYGFEDCTQLTDVTIPASVTHIGNYAFQDCTSLYNFCVETGNTAFIDIDGVLFSASATELIAYPAGKSGSYAIPDGVTSIGQWAFHGCSGLTNVTIPDGVTCIRSRAFDGCSSLTSVVIPNSVTSIESSVFVNCWRLTSITIPQAISSQSSRWNLPSGCEILIAENLKTLHVDAATGDDANDGLSWATAKASIQAAINIATAGDTILVNDGRYEPISTGNKLIVIRSVNGAEATAIDASLQWPNGVTNRCATLGTANNHVKTVLSGFCLTNGIAANGGGSYYGTLTNCVLSGNTATNSGGGVYSGVLRDCTIFGNTATNYGGGAYSGVLHDCLIFGNTAKYGGGSYNGTLYNCTLSGNTASSGGGSYYGTLTNCLLSGNTATDSGGGAYSGTLRDCLISGNTAKNGGGSSIGTLNNCIVSNNTATTYGGGANRGTLRDCLIIGNTAKYGGGSYNGTLYNCTLSGNTATYNGGGSNSGTLNNCIVWDNTARTSNAVYQSTCQYSCLDQNVTGTGNVFANPMFVDAANGDFRLQPGSPCIDAGSNEYATGDTDIAGNPRILGSAVDMGAFEFDPNSLVADHTVTTPLPVPYSWLSTDAASILAAANGDYEAAANATAANGVNKVWECYVAGLDPTDTTARFEATITMDANGKPVISWNPPLPASEAAKREYRILGAKSLGGAWTDVTDMADPDAEGYRFFKVKVRMEE